MDFHIFSRAAISQGEESLELLLTPLLDEGFFVAFDGLPHLLELAEGLPFLDTVLLDEDGLVLVEWHWIGIGSPCSFM